MIGLLIAAFEHITGGAKSHVERSKGEMKGSVERTEAEAKPFEAPGHDGNAEVVKAKGKVTGTVERDKGDAKALSKKMKDQPRKDNHRS